MKWIIFALIAEVLLLVLLPGGHVKAVARSEKQVILQPSQIKQAICSGGQDINGTWLDCVVMPTGSKL